ncbi:hypothetical protein MSG28_002964 [Choristoneura fumiferana]|uniref:Uncharacterized protein n=1 Tax=Choristoneura fumiferana TaxID=7141 RepID=A0ACC0JK39_CHOFU|nr:hypothetical protein MSG28_002964 [Choristoneura fumiferana]
MPLNMCSCRAIVAYLVTATIGHLGLNLDTIWADLPVVVTTIIAAAIVLFAAITAATAVPVAASQGISLSSKGASHLEKRKWITNDKLPIVAMIVDLLCFFDKQMEDPKEYVKINEMTRRDAKEVLEKIPIKWKKVDARVLDIGCGDGGVTSNILKKYMPENFKKLVGCDKNIECVKYAQEHYGNEKVHFMALDVEEKIPDELKETFDHIFSSYAFNWIRKQEIAFTNVYDMLTEGGNCQLLFVGHSNAFQVFDDLSRTPKWRSHLENVHTKFTSPYFHSQDPAGEIQTMMKRIGFKDIDDSIH